MCSTVLLWEYYFGISVVHSKSTGNYLNTGHKTPSYDTHRLQAACKELFETKSFRRSHWSSDILRGLELARDFQEHLFD